MDHSLGGLRQGFLGEFTHSRALGEKKKGLIMQEGEKKNTGEFQAEELRWEEHRDEGEAEAQAGERTASIWRGSEVPEESDVRGRSISRVWPRITQSVCTEECWSGLKDMNNSSVCFLEIQQ